MTAQDHAADSDMKGLMNMDTPTERYRLPEATRLLLGDNHGLKDPERWVRKQIKLGRFPAQKIGRSWFMRPVDIEAAEAALIPDLPPAPRLPEAVERSVGAVHPDILAGMSARSRRRVKARHR